MDIIIPGGDLVEDIVSGNLIVFNHTSDLEFLDLSDNGDLFRVLVPNETFQNNFFFDFLPKTIKIKSFFVDLNIEDNNGFSNWLFFLLLFLNFWLGLGGSRGGS